MRGFTLLESLIYMVLFSLIMSGSFAGISALTESANRNETRAFLQSEGDFLLGKMSYEVAEGVPISAFSLNGTSLMFSGLSLSSANVQVGDLRILNLPSGIPHFTSIQTSFTLSAPTANGQVLSEHFSGISYSSL